MDCVVRSSLSQVIGAAICLPQPEIIIYTNSREKFLKSKFDLVTWLLENYCWFTTKNVRKSKLFIWHTKCHKCLLRIPSISSVLCTYNALSSLPVGLSQLFHSPGVFIPFLSFL